MCTVLMPPGVNAIAVNKYTINITKALILNPSYFRIENVFDEVKKLCW